MDEKHNGNRNSWCVALLPIAGLSSLEFGSAAVTGSGLKAAGGAIAGTTTEKALVSGLTALQGGIIMKKIIVIGIIVGSSFGLGWVSNSPEGTHTGDESSSPGFLGILPPLPADADRDQVDAEIEQLRQDKESLLAQIQQLKRRSPFDSQLKAALLELQDLDNLSASPATSILQKLIGIGDAAIPELEKLLRSGVNKRFSQGEEPLNTYQEVPSLRIGIFNALRKIGGAEALAIVIEAVPSAQDHHEVFEASQLMIKEEGAVDEYREKLVAGLHSVYDSQGLVELNENRQQIMSKYTDLLTRDHGKELIDSERLRLQAYQEEMARLADEVNGTAPIHIYGMDHAMIYRLDAIDEFHQEIEASGRYGLQFLAITLDPQEALQQFESSFRALRGTHRLSEVMEAIGAIQSPASREFIARNYASLDPQSKTFAIEGLMVGLNRVGNGTTVTDPFVANYDHRRRNPEPLRPSTRALFNETSSLLKALQAEVKSDVVRQRIERALKDLERNMPHQ